MSVIDLSRQHPLDAAKLIAQLRMDIWNLDRFNNMNKRKMTQAEVEDVKTYVERITGHKQEEE